eukprot:6188995-Pleurochrysis_carterae.AAC.1
MPIRPFPHYTHDHTPTSLPASMPACPRPHARAQRRLPPLFPPLRVALLPVSAVAASLRRRGWLKCAAHAARLVARFRDGQAASFVERRRV